MKRVKVVAHVYFKGHAELSRNYHARRFPIGTVCQCDKYGLVTSPLGSAQYMNDGELSAHSCQSAIIFRPV